MTVTYEKAAPKRVRRTFDERLAALEQERERLEERKALRAAKESPTAKAALAALGALERALSAATENNHSALKRAASDAREPLVGFFESEGLPLPSPRGPRARKGAKRS